MKFNKIIRGNARETNTEEDLHNVLDAGFMCTLAVVHNKVPLQIPTTYGRKGNVLYTHGSQKNFILNEALKVEQVSISITHLDGIVPAKTLFNTSANYRSAVLFGKMTKIIDEEDRMKALRIITENILPNRWEEVQIGSDNELKATLVTKFEIESASVKIRTGGPSGDEKEETTEWSGHIPMKLVTETPVFDENRKIKRPLSKSIRLFCEKFS